MKINFVAPVVGQNGGSRVVAIYAKKLLALGHDVRVFACAPPVPSFRDRAKSLLKGKLPKSLPASRTLFFDGLGDRFKEVLPLRQPIRPEQMPDADVVIATWWETAYQVAALPSGKGAKVYFVQGHEIFDPTVSHISRGSYYLPLHKITISSHLRDIHEKEYGSPGVPVVPNSVDLDQFHAPPREKNARPTVGLLYAPKEIKGLDVSLEAIRIARKTFPDLRVVAFGTPPQHPQYPLPEDGLFVQQPPQDQIRDLYAQCDVWLCGSRTEGFHLPPLEAMACRCPVVTTRIGGAVEIVTEGVNGHIVEVEDAAALGAQLTDVLSLAPSEWRAWSDAAYARARSYTWDDATAAFAAELEKAVAAG